MSTTQNRAPQSWAGTHIACLGTPAPDELRAAMRALDVRDGPSGNEDTTVLVRRRGVTLRIDQSPHDEIARLRNEVERLDKALRAALVGRCPTCYRGD